MKDLDVYLLLILIIVGIGSCSIYQVRRVDAIVANVLDAAPGLRR